MLSYSGYAVDMADKKLPDWYLRKLSKAGKIGGKRSLETMTPAERTARAKKAAAASAKVRKKKAKKPKGE
jgi:predicted MarR family transcription regulator